MHATGDLVDFGDLPTWIGAVGGFGTMLIAAAAAIIALRQLGEARLLREEQAQPFVVVDIEANAAGDMIYTELVIRNIGRTLAKDVRITFDPPLVSTLDEKSSIGPLREASILQQGIPSMPPGREYRLLFEHMPDRYKREDLPRRYEVTVEFASQRRREEPLVQTLDLDVLYGYEMIQAYGVHHLAKTMRAWAKRAGIRNF